MLEGVWSSKADAGQWALAKVADDDLVRRALESGDGGSPDISPEEAAAFGAHVLRSISGQPAVDH